MDASFLCGRVDDVLCREERLDYDIVDLRPEEVHVDLDLFEVLAEGRETPFETVVIIL